MPVVRRLLVFLSNLLALLVLVALLAGAGWGAWQLLPESSRSVLRDPGGAAAAAQRGASRGPANPFTDLIGWLREWFAERRDLVDRVHSADGTTGGIEPLPAWTSTAERRVFGTTETLWQSRRGKLSGARWSRLVFSWADIQPRGARDWRAGHYLRDDLIRRERGNGIELVGLLMSTPSWAASRPQDGVRAVPAGLYRPVDDPQNAWAVFVRRMAAEYRGRIDTWIIWNEPDIRPGGPNAQYFSWAGDERDYAQLLKVASLAAKRGNPGARIVFASTTYWADQNAGNPLFLERVLSVLAEDPEARAAGYYFDVVGLNLYSSPDDLYRVAGIYREVLSRYGSSAPLWLTETNAVPYDDPTSGLRREPNGLRVTMEEQASFIVQAFAMGLAGGYERLAFHSLVDRNTDDELWGLVRNDGSLRPAFVAYQTATRYFDGVWRATFAGRERAEWRWHRGGFVPNWQIYQVVLDRETPAQGSQRVTVLWNGDATPVEVTVPRLSEAALLVDKYGRPQPLVAEGDRWRITLAGATAHSPLDPEGFYFVGGAPLLLVEDGVAPDTPISPPTLA
jgi:hypothetical protein